MHQRVLNGFRIRYAFSFKSEHCGCTLNDILLRVANTPADIAATFYFPHHLADDKHYNEIEEISILIHDSLIVLAKAVFSPCKRVKEGM